MTTPREALAALLAKHPECLDCNRPATFGVDPSYRATHCRHHALASHELTYYGDAIEQAERALAAPEPVVVTFTRNIDGAEFVYVGDAGPEGRMYIGFSGDAVARVTEALGARVVRR